MIVALNPDTVIAKCLETAFNLKQYIEIMDEAGRDGFTVTPEFRVKFNGFYQVRQKKPQWYDRYYLLLEEQKITRRSFEELLWEMYSVSHTIEVSFVSKMMATADADTPIWDQYVIRNLGYEKRWEKLRSAQAEERISAATEIYEEIKRWYRDFSSSADGKACIKAFDFALPGYKDRLSLVKKIDYMLWSKR